MTQNNDPAMVIPLNVFAAMAFICLCALETKISLFAQLFYHDCRETHLTTTQTTSLHWSTSGYERQKSHRWTTSGTPRQLEGRICH